MESNKSSRNGGTDVQRQRANNQYVLSLCKSEDSAKIERAVYEYLGLAKHAGMKATMNPNPITSSSCVFNTFRKESPQPLWSSFDIIWASIT